MEIGESIAVQVSMPDKGEPCWACEEAPKAPLSPNDLVEDPSSLGDAENQLKNDSSKLGQKLGHRPTWRIRAPATSPGSVRVEHVVEVTPGAHHLIPGNASLKQVPSLLGLMEQSRGKVSKDIGYDVNCAQNGVWLAASYGVTPGSVLQIKWTNYAHQNEYARAAMKAAGTQFHDAHPIYSENVQATLRSLADKIRLEAPTRCGICGKTIDDKSRPPYGLVGRLHSVSRMHRRFLVGPVRKWPLGSGYFTSARSALMSSSLAGV